MHHCIYTHQGACLELLLLSVQRFRRFWLTVLCSHSLLLFVGAVSSSHASRLMTLTRALVPLVREAIRLLAQEGTPLLATQPAVLRLEHGA